MTVQELLDALSEFPPEMEVKVAGFDKTGALVLGTPTPPVIGKGYRGEHVRIISTLPVR